MSKKTRKKRNLRVLGILVVVILLVAAGFVTAGSSRPETVTIEPTVVFSPTDTSVPSEEVVASSVPVGEMKEQFLELLEKTAKREDIPRLASLASEEFLQQARDQDHQSVMSLGDEGFWKAQMMTVVYQPVPKRAVQVEIDPIEIVIVGSYKVLRFDLNVYPALLESPNSWSCLTQEYIHLRQISQIYSDLEQEVGGIGSQEFGDRAISTLKKKLPEMEAEAQWIQMFWYFKGYGEPEQDAMWVSVQKEWTQLFGEFAQEAEVDEYGIPIGFKEHDSYGIWQETVREQYPALQNQ
ncbi:hypothetical protein JW710_02150 [Candidatus Dojkabacteria bacterium]|nr:hypothetical protein [Candidatus Dojkabacteria bacterium]